MGQSNSGLLFQLASYKRSNEDRSLSSSSQCLICEAEACHDTFLLSKPTFTTSTLRPSVPDPPSPVGGPPVSFTEFGDDQSEAVPLRWDLGFAALDVFTATSQGDFCFLLWPHWRMSLVAFDEAPYGLGRKQHSELPVSLASDILYDTVLWLLRLLLASSDVCIRPLLLPTHIGQGRVRLCRPSSTGGLYAVG